MSAPEFMDCRHARFEIGGDPRSVSQALAAHLSGCAACSRFRADTLALDARLTLAMEMPLSEFRQNTARTRARPFALAASLLLALVMGAVVWTVRPGPALAGELVRHVVHESGSWDLHATVPAEEVAAVLQKAGIQFDARFAIVYASACPFHGRTIPHLVIRTEQGPLTVMLLEHETVAKRTEFDEGGYRGVLLPAGGGSVAVLARAADRTVPGAVSSEVVSAVRW